MGGGGEQEGVNANQNCPVHYDIFCLLRIVHLKTNRALRKMLINLMFPRFFLLLPS